ncbi:hypothetical protein Tco_0906296, partial [Tanacetum coccineum]
APTPRSPQIGIPFAQIRLRRVRKTVRLEPHMSPSMEARIAEYAAAPAPPSPPPLLLSPWPPPLSQIPLPPLPPLPSSLHLPPPLPTSLPLPSSPLPPLPVLLFIPLLVDRREDIPKAELPPHKRLCLTAPTSRYEVRERLFATACSETYCKVIEQDYRLPALQCRRSDIGEPRSSIMALGMFGYIGQDTGLLGQEIETHSDDHEGADLNSIITICRQEDPLLLQELLLLLLQGLLAAAVEQLIKARVSVALVNHETLRNNTNGHGDGSHNFETGIKGTVRTPRECTYKDFLNCKPFTFKGTEGVVVLSQWFKKMESVFYISNCVVENQVKFATCTFLRNALTWWNSHIKTVTKDVAYSMD